MRVASKGSCGACRDVRHDSGMVTPANSNKTLLAVMPFDNWRDVDTTDQAGTGSMAELTLD